MHDHDPVSVSPDPAELRLRVPRRRVSGIRRSYVRLAIAVLAIVVAIALIVGFGIDFRRPRNGSAEINLSRESRPAQLDGLPGSYADLPRPKTSAPVTTNTDGAAAEDAEALLRKQNEELCQHLASMMAAIDRIGAENKKLLEQIARFESEALKEQAKSWASAIFIKRDAPVADARTIAATQEGAATADDALRSRSGLGSTASSTEGRSLQPPTDQERKLAFLNTAAAPGVHLDQPYLYPRSPYEIQAGSVIPAALLTGINTDLPGDIVAVVTAPVYDSRTGQHLLIPQGAKLYGAYDSQIANGQNRALVVWHRLLMPNGRSIVLDRMRSVDAAGYAGVADRVDYHFDKLAMSTALSTAIAYAGQIAQGTGSNQGSGQRDVIGRTVSQQASRVGSRIIDRQLDVQPTITVRPGWPVRVLVHRDMMLEPYHD